MDKYRIEVIDAQVLETIRGLSRIETCYASTETIAKNSYLTYGEVRGALKRLQDKKIIKIWFPKDHKFMAKQPISVNGRKLPDTMPRIIYLVPKVGSAPASVLLERLACHFARLNCLFKEKVQARYYIGPLGIFPEMLPHIIQQAVKMGLVTPGTLKTDDKGDSVTNRPLVDLITLEAKHNLLSLEQKDPEFPYTYCDFDFKKRNQYDPDFKRNAYINQCLSKHSIITTQNSRNRVKEYLIKTLENGPIYITNAQIQQTCQSSSATVKRALSDLTKNNIIKTTYFQKLTKNRVISLVDAQVTEFTVQPTPTTPFDPVSKYRFEEYSLDKTPMRTKLETKPVEKPQPKRPTTIQEALLDWDDLMKDFPSLGEDDPPEEESEKPTDEEIATQSRLEFEQNERLYAKRKAIHEEKYSNLLRKHKE